MSPTIFNTDHLKNAIQDVIIRVYDHSIYDKDYAVNEIMKFINEYLDNNSTEEDL